MEKSPGDAESAVVFSPPPSWPVEPGFVPPVGWSPDPAWGPAPEGWTFWLPAETPANAAAETQVLPVSEPAEVAAESETLAVAELEEGATEPKKWRTTAILAVVAAALAIVVIVLVVQQRQRAAELAAARDGYESAVSVLATSLETAKGVLADSEGAVLDESSRDVLATEIAEASEILGVPVDQDEVDALTEQSSELDDADSQLDTAVTVVAAQEELAAARTAANEALPGAEQVLAGSEGKVTDPGLRDGLAAAIEGVRTEVAKDTAGLGVNELSALKSDVKSAKQQMDTAAYKVTVNQAAQEELAAARTAANEALPGAEQVLAGSEGKVTDPGLRDGLAAAIEGVRTEVAKDTAGLDVNELSALKSDVGTATLQMSTAIEKVTVNQAAWQKEADEAAAAAALLNPASYAAISTRDWQLVERDPAAYTGNKYVIYGRVTQFDSNTGDSHFRADTDGQKQYHWYNFDINTMVTGSADVLTKAVKGDLVKLYVVVVGPYSYTTTMGGEMTVPKVKANIIEVYGSD